MTHDKDQSKPIQLTKYLANCGLCSRRKAEELIKSGQISVNNFVITNPAHRISATDAVRHKKKLVKPEQKVYILLNKPKNYVTTVSDPHHTKTVLELVKKASPVRLYPVGRLDKDTTGLLLITNDGELAQNLSHPKHEIKKIYHVVLKTPLDEKHLKRIKMGIKLYDGRIKADRAYYIKDKPKTHIGLAIHSGKNRIIRRIFIALGYKIKSLDRVRYAGLTKRGLLPGNWRFLTKKEIETLQK